ncbi:MAG: Two component sensor histidine kinase [Gammaproteobacteria bacterium]|nr:Two component sensor histidine kinase [Gammaproteobacteria bacterium]
MQVWAALLMTMAICAHARGASDDELPVPQARIDSKIVHLQVTEGTDIRFTRLSRAQGLSQTRVEGIVQDDRGFMWFGSQYGANRYDGHEFRSFRHIEGDARSLCGVYIRTLFEDREGRLWLGCERMLDRYEPATETFTHYQFEASASSELAATPRHISEGNDGMLWVATGHGLYRLDPSSGQSVSFHHDAANPASLSSNDVKSTCIDRGGTLWVATGEGIDAFDPRTARVTFHVPLRESREMSMLEDRAGVFWIIYASDNGLAALDRKSRVLTRYSFAKTPVSSETLTGVSSILEDAEGQLWLGTHSDGLLKLDGNRLKATRYRNDPANYESLAENRTTTLQQDREGNIWVGLGASEPNHFSPKPAPFRPLPFDAGNPDNLGEKLVNVLFEDSHGTLWIGTTGALNRYDRATRSYQRFQIPGNSVSSDVLSIVEDRAGALWVGTSGQGLAKLDTTTGKLKIYRHLTGDARTLSDNVVTHLSIDHNGTLWANTGNGLNRYDAVTESFSSFRQETDFWSALYIGLAEARDGTLWISGVPGLLHFDPGKSEFVPHKDGSQLRGFAVLASSAGEVWAGTQNGLYRYDPSSGRSHVYTHRDGLASNAISCILEDAYGDLWMSTTEGISRLRPDSGRFRNYSVADGLPGRDLTGWGACFRSARGTLYFGGFAGAVEFDPNTVLDELYTPPVVLTGLEVSGDLVQPGPGSLLTHTMGYTKELTLSNSQRSFAVQFAALSFRSPDTNRYRYLLEGLDADWQEVGSDRRFASYTTLPPGVYNLRVQGATNRSPWSEPGASLRITVEPPWWGMWQFRVAVILVLVALAITAYAYRVRHLARQMEIRFEERMSERTRIARDLHDSLLQSFQGLILQLQAILNMLPRRAAEAAQALGLALDRADQAIDEGRAAVQQLRTPSLLEADIVRSLKLLAEDTITAQPVAFRVVLEGRTRPLVPLVHDEACRIAQEAFRNAVQHANASAIEAELTFGDKRFILRIRDDGAGFDPRRIEHSERGGHWGVRGMRERAGAINGKLEVWSQKGAGTEIELTVPAGVAYARAGARQASLDLNTEQGRS